MTFREVVQLVSPIAVFFGAFGLIWSLRPQLVANHPQGWKFIAWTLGVAGVLVLVVTVGQIIEFMLRAPSA